MEFPPASHPCTTSQDFGPSDFPGCRWNGSASFKLLGAAIGPAGWCEELLAGRFGKARGLLQAVGRFPSSGSLRHSASALLMRIFARRSVAHSPTTAGAWPPWESPLVASAPTPLPNTPQLHMLPVTCGGLPSSIFLPGTGVYAELETSSHKSLSSKIETQGAFSRVILMASHGDAKVESWPQIL